MRQQVVAYLSLHMSFPAGKSKRPLRKDVRSYHERIDSRFFQLGRLAHVSKGSRSAHDWETEDGKRFWTQDFYLRIHNSSAVESTAAHIVDIVRRVGIKSNHKFEIQMQVVRENEERDVYWKRIYPSRDTDWILDQPRVTLKASPETVTDFPPHLAYLAEIAGRCFLVGGNDVWALLRKQSDLEKCLNALSVEDREKLIGIYQEIVRKKHNQWFLAWCRNDGEEHPKWADELSWLFCFLDRLREGGLMEKTRGLAKKTVLCYWDDYLGGEPYLED